MFANNVVLFEKIPAELRALERWVGWKFVARKGQPGKFAKIPFDAKTGLQASCSDPETWSAFGVAVRAFQTGLYNGVGFQLGDWYVGIDIDNCRDPETGAMDSRACEIVRAFSSYSEVSPSGKGCKIFVKGKLPNGPRVRNMGTMKIEIYGSSRYFATTGRRFRQMPSEVKDCEETLIREYERLFKSRESEKPITVQPLRNSNASSVEEEISRIRSMSDNGRLKKLWSGDQSGYGSQSEADLALCAMLALQFGCDAALIDSLFRRSKLLRPKWDEIHSAGRRTYGQMTIAKAVATASHEFRKQFDVRTPGELHERARDLGRVPFIVEGLFPARSLALLAGDSGVGKSPLVYQLALCVAAGIPFLGHRVKRGRVLYLDFENGVNQVDSLVSRLARHLGLNQLPMEFNFWNRNDSAQEGVTHAIKSVTKLKPILVIIDSLGSFAPAIESKNSVANETLQTLRGVIHDSGATIVLVHHLRKESRKHGETSESLEGNFHRWFQEVRGPRAIINGSDVRLGVALPRSARIVTGLRQQSEIAFVLRGFARIQGEIPTCYIERALDREGEPLGYQKLSGVALLRNPKQETVFHDLPPTFRFKTAKFMYGKGDQATADLLKKYVALGIARKTSSGYEKTDGIVPSGHNSEVELAG